GGPEHLCVCAQARERGRVGHHARAGVRCDRRAGGPTPACAGPRGQRSVGRAREHAAAPESVVQPTLGVGCGCDDRADGRGRGAGRFELARRGSRSGLVGGTMIVPDQATNALVIRTAPPNFAVLQETIDRLDVRPPQVLLEVLIAEINLDRNTSTGINWQLYSHAGLQGDSTRGVLGGFGSQNFTGDSGLTSLGGLGIRVVSLATLNVRALLQAVAAHTSFRVLSAPRVLALNNEQARILVGSEVPFTSATISGITSSVDQVVDYRDVGTQLTVLPQINADGYVTLRLLQEVSELSSTTLAAAQNAPIITTREAETSAIVKSGRTVVIGGLISSSRNLTETGIPILKDIPLIGGLFKDRTLDRAKSELAIFLTPYVVFSDEQADSVLQQERKKMPDLKEPLDSILAPKPQ